MTKTYKIDAEFCFSCKQLKLRKKDSSSQLIKNLAPSTKDQSISKCLFSAIVSTKKPIIFFKEFLP